MLKSNRVAIWIAAAGVVVAIGVLVAILSHQVSAQQQDEARLANEERSAQDSELAATIAESRRLRQSMSQTLVADLIDMKIIARFDLDRHEPKVWIGERWHHDDGPGYLSVIHAYNGAVYDLPRDRTIVNATVTRPGIKPPPLLIVQGVSGGHEVIGTYSPDEGYQLANR